MATRKVMIEIRVPRGLAPEAVLSLASHEIRLPGLTLDYAYQPVAVPPASKQAAELLTEHEQYMVIRGTIEAGQEEALEREPRVAAVWGEARIEAFGGEEEVSPSDLAFGL